MIGVALPRVTTCRAQHVCVAILLAATAANFIAQPGQAYQIGPAHWRMLRTSLKLDNIVTNKHNASVYASAGRQIFRYSSEPEARLTELYTAGQDTAAGPYENRVLKSVLIGDREKLLSCWTDRDRNLTCGLLDLAARAFTTLTWAFADKSLTFRLDPNEQIQVLPDEEAAGRLLIVTLVNGPPLEQTLNFSAGPGAVNERPYNLPAMARFELDPSNRLSIMASLPYHTNKPGDIVLYGYPFAFNHLAHTYFVVQNKRNIPPNRVSSYVKLARICKNDTRLASYTEIGVSCSGKHDLGAKVVYFDGSHLADAVFYIVYEKMEFEDDYLASSFCSYAMSQVRDVFDKVTLKCHSGHPNATLLSKLHHGDPSADHGYGGRVHGCQQSNTSDWCTSEANPYINGVVPRTFARGLAPFGVWGVGTSFMFATRQRGPVSDASRARDQDEVVYFLGAESGLLTKYSARIKEPLYTINIHENRAVQYYHDLSRSEPRYYPHTNLTANMTAHARGTKYETLGHTVIAVNKLGEIHELPMDSCQYYPTCFSCLGVADPLKCAWCTDSCHSACPASKIQTRTCPPYIRGLWPASVPTGARAAKLYIVGDGFGGPIPPPRVLVGGRECAVNTSTSYNFQIECQVPQENAPSNVSVTVSQLDKLSLDVPIEGAATYSEPLQYKQVSVYGIEGLARGPRHRQSEINITGQNLEVGGKMTVMLGETACSVIKITPKRVTCSAMPLNDSQLLPEVRSKREVEQPLRVFIDDDLQDVTRAAGPSNTSAVFVFYGEPSPSPASQLDARKGQVNLAMLAGLASLALALASALCFVYRSRVANRGRKSGKPLSDAEQSDEYLTDLKNLNGKSTRNNYQGEVTGSEERDRCLDDKLMAELAADKILIERSRLTLGPVLGSGQFGRVYKGLLQAAAGDPAPGEPVPVAVKTLHDHTQRNDEQDAFLREGLMMKHFEHENVLALLGVTFNAAGLPMVITPFMQHGDLRSYIRDESATFTVKGLVEFGIQVARGMAYLSRLKFVHRDLAARNCMLDERMVVKVADFGLSRDIYERDYYSSNQKDAKLPVKWMAPESLENATYTTKSDVWSYGVVLWELTTLGVKPYPDVDNFDMAGYLKSGRRMLRPRNCPLGLYKIMLACWSARPEDRPDFGELVELVPRVISVRLACGSSEEMQEAQPAASVP